MTDGTRDVFALPQTEVHLATLGAHLKAHRLDIEFTARGLLVSNPDADACCVEAGLPKRADTITCRPHAADGGRLWLFTSWNEPIAEADHITDAVVAIKGYLAGGS